MFNLAFLFYNPIIMSTSNRLAQVFSLIDAQNSQDPNIENTSSGAQPKELLYAQRMTEKLLQFEPNVSEQVQIAARAQHICRWKIARNSYPMDRVGYLKWRQDLKKFHADLTAKLLRQVGYNDDFIARVSFLIEKKLLKKDAETQLLEDVICLVFLEYYFEEFIHKHDDDKLIDIVKKTWAKMSEDGHQAALKLSYSDKALSIIQKALA